MKCMDDAYLYSDTPTMCAMQRKSICLLRHLRILKSIIKHYFRASVGYDDDIVVRMVWLISVYVNCMNTKLMQFGESVASHNIMYLDDFLKI